MDISERVFHDFLKRQIVVYETAKPPGTPAADYVIDATDRVRVPRGEASPVRLVRSYLARHKVTGALSWVKTFGKASSGPYLHEQELFASLVHPTLLGVIGLSFPTKTEDGTIVTECMPHRSLKELIKDTERYSALSPTTKAKIVVGIVLCLKYMHACNVAHHDLKPSNILLDEF
jgi:hypothetical protein